MNTTTTCNLFKTQQRPRLNSRYLSQLTLGMDSYDKTICSSSYSSSELQDFGFFWAFVDSATSGHDLVISPTQVMLQILTQFSHYVNYHSRTLKPLFVKTDEMLINLHDCTNDKKY